MERKINTNFRQCSIQLTNTEKEEKPERKNQKSFLGNLG